MPNRNPVIKKQEKQIDGTIIAATLADNHYEARSVNDKEAEDKINIFVRRNGVLESYDRYSGTVLTFDTWQEAANDLQQYWDTMDRSRNLIATQNKAFTELPNA